MPDPFIIAELAQGYEGKPAQAVALISAAAAAGADAVKLQLVYAEELATSDYKHYEVFRGLEMPDGVWHELAGQAAARSIEFQADVFGPRSLRLAQEIGAAAVKIHSTDMGNPALLNAVAESGISDVLLSTGGCMPTEIAQALDMLARKRIVLLHGFQGYPTPVDANQIIRLRQLAVLYQQGRPDVRLGFADHADPAGGLSELLSAVALGAGATVLEKHLTLAKVLKLEDHESALSPDEFSDFVRHMRACSAALGTAAWAVFRDGIAFESRLHPSEVAYRAMTRKHVVAASDLPGGTMLVAGHLVLKRTSSSTFVQDLREVVGRRLTRSVKKDEAISHGVLEATS
ncbi:MAG: N-acetylneuraminate synthase family protein [Woeseiaceae bacterium]